MQSPLFGEGFFNAVQFLALGRAKEIVAGNRPESEMTPSEFFVAGGLCGLAAALVESPIDLVKCQLQSAVFHERPAFNSFGGCVAAILRQNGVLGLWQGMVSCWLRTVPSSACYFGVYETSRMWFSEMTTQRKQDLQAPFVLMSGGLGGIAYWLSTYPIDSVKSAIQSDSIIKSQRQYSGVLDCAHKLYKRGGVARFYQGLTPCLLRSFPANAVCFFAYEKAKAILG